MPWKKQVSAEPLKLECVRRHPVHRFLPSLQNFWERSSSPWSPSMLDVSSEYIQKYSLVSLRKYTRYKQKEKDAAIVKIYDLWCETPNHKRQNLRRAPYVWVFETLPSAFLRIPQQQMNVIRTKNSRKAEVGNAFIHSSRQTMQTKQPSNRDHMAKILITVSG